MKKLLINIETAELSKKYLFYGVKLAKDLGLNVHFVHVFNPNNYPLGMPDTTGAEVQMIQENIEKVTKTVSEDLEGYIEEFRETVPNSPTLTYSVEQGFTIDVIKEMVVKDGYDMVMIESGHKDHTYFMSDRSMDIVRKTTVPVWIIPREKDYKAYEHMIYATDYHEEDITTLKRLVRVAELFMADITALHITNNLDFDERVKNTGFRNIIVEKTNYDKINVKTLVDKDEEDVVDILNNYATFSKSDLIVMLKENRHFLDRIFKSSATKKLIKETHLPVLVFHEQEK